MDGFLRDEGDKPAVGFIGLLLRRRINEPSYFLREPRVLQRSSVGVDGSDDGSV